MVFLLVHWSRSFADDRKLKFLEIASLKGKLKCVSVLTLGCKEATYWCAIFYETAEENGKALKYFNLLGD